MPPQTTLGIDIGGTKIAGVLVALDGQILAETRIPTRAAEGVSAVVAQVAQAVEQLGQAAQMPLTPSTCRGVGVGSPGHIDGAAGIVRYARNLNWRDVPLRDLLAEALQLPVQLENDVTTALIGERRFGAAQNVSDAVLLSVGTGLGGAALVNGQVLRGVASFALEVGQIRLKDQPDVLEQTASGLGLGVLAAALRPQYPESALPVDAETAQIIAAARADDPLARAALNAMIADVIEAAVWTCGLLNPARLIIGGGMGHAIAAELLPAVRQGIETRTAYPTYESVEVVLSQIHQTALGAAALMLPE